MFFDRAEDAMFTFLLLRRPASFRDDQPACIGGAPKQTSQFECLIAFQTWWHQARKLQGVYGKGTPIIPAG
jgi:hypothetical protein